MIAETMLRSLSLYPREGANVMPKSMASPPSPQPSPRTGEGANVMPKPIDD
jgi:hypothetical protein